MNLSDLVAMAHMYRNTCTMQEEKFGDHKRETTGWAWDDCQAAYHLLKEQYGSCYWELWETWRAGSLRPDMPIAPDGLSMLRDLYSEPAP